MSISRYEIGKEYLFLRFVHSVKNDEESFSVDPTGDSCKSIQIKRLRATDSYYLDDDDAKRVKCYSFESLSDGAKYLNEPVPISGEKITIEKKNLVTKDVQDLSKDDMDVVFIDARFVVEAYKENDKVIGKIREIEGRQGVKIGFDVDLDGKKIEGRPSKAEEYIF